MKINLICLLLAGLAYVSHSAAVASTECSVRYYETLTEAINIKRTCDTASFYDCCQIINFIPTAPTGLYEISATTVGPFSATKLFARCDMDCDDGGWTIIQRRVAGGTVDFYRKWNDYELGFGNLEEEFWLGLKNIYCLTTRDDVELRIDIEDEQGNKATWTYQEFRVDGPTDKYRLHIGQAEGPLGSFDAMAYHNNRQFSTYDSDNDEYGGNCAQVYRGAWWYNQCFHSNLNGPHDPITPPPPTPTANRVMWYDGSAWIYHPNVEMKVRPKNCQLKSC